MTSSVLSYSISQTKLLFNLPRISLKAVQLFCFVVITFLFGLYLFQVKGMAEEAYSLGFYERKFSQLVRENQNLKINSVQVNSLEELEALVSNLNFEKAEGVEYIKTGDNKVAAK